MKLSLKLSCAALIMISGSAQALNPVQGFYAGIFLGGSWSPNLNLNLDHPLTFASTPVSLKYKVLGDAGGELGYRMDQFRIESELLYNYAPYQSLTIAGYTILSPKKNTGLRMKGSTSTGAILLNGYYDAYFLWEQSNWVPYVGAGIGYAYVQNSLNFYYNDVQISGAKISDHANTPIGQVIAGVNFFMDDFTTFSLDARYFSTKKIDPFNTNVQSVSLNLSFNGAFDAG